MSLEKVAPWVTPATKRGKAGYLVRYRRADGSIGQRGGLFTRAADAYDFRRQLEEALNAPSGEALWATVKARFKAEVLAGLKPSGRGKWRSATNRLEAFADPRLLSELDADLLSRFGAHLRAGKLATPTIRGYLAEIHRTVAWAATIWPGYRAPPIRRTKAYVSQQEKRRPVTTEEFDRMLDSTAGVVGEEYADSWQHTLRGFWLSGLRLNDVHVLRWDSGLLAVQDIDTDCPRLYVAAGADKSGREETLPMWHFPDLVEFLRACDSRRGFVFRPMAPKGRASYDTLSRRISAIGEAARIVVPLGTTFDPETGELIERTKFASAHQLRASWATRWAPKVPRELLRRWMRHRSYQTTDQYYVDVDVENLEPRPTRGIANSDTPRLEV